MFYFTSHVVAQQNIIITGIQIEAYKCTLNGFGMIRLQFLLFACSKKARFKANLFSMVRHSLQNLHSYIKQSTLRKLSDISHLSVGRRLTFKTVQYIAACKTPIISFFNFKGYLNSIIQFNSSLQRIPNNGLCLK